MWRTPATTSSSRFEVPMPEKSHMEELTADTKLMAGVQTYFVPANVTITVAGVVVTSAQMEAAIQSRITAANSATSAKASLAQAVKAREATVASTQSVVDAVTQIALIMYANQPDVLTTFGISPRKVPVPLTAQEKAERAAKAKATRAARNTMGPKQKAKVKGTVAPVVAPSATPSPTPSAASNGSTQAAVPVATSVATGHS
jgi:hypothetical protein